MKKAVVPFLFLLLWVSFAKAQSWPYSLANVPEEIKNKANVITHYQSTEVETESIDKVTIKVHRIYTVVNEDGKAALVFNKQTSKYVTLEDVEIKVYDAAGKQTGKYKKKDMVTTATGEGLIEDGYVTFFPVSTSSYPVTIDVKYEQKIRSTLFFPDFRFISPREGIIESSYTVKIPSEIGLRYKAKNTLIEPMITDEGNYKIYKWTVKNLAPIEYEEGSVSFSSGSPHILIVTDKFSHLGFEGDLSSWKSFGNWLKDLYRGLDDLPADRQQFFLFLTKDAPNEKEKIRRIYEYMQLNFRYVSIQLGIGGLRPFSADFTDKKKYGDCKALSNYMRAALKTVGIKSYVAIINAEYDEEPVDPDFPANEFNHVILCVPGQKDSTWLECTSSSAEFGVLGTFTENRNALLITDDGGVLVPTPVSHSDENIITTKTTVSLDNDLSGLVETVFATRGAFRGIINEMLKQNRDNQKQDIVYYFGFKQPDDFILENDSAENKTVLKMAVAKVPEFNSGNKLFISSRMYKLWSRTLPKADNRKSDFYFRYPFEKNDTTVLKLPSGMKPETLPKETELRNNYVWYKTKYWFNDKENAVYSVTELTLKQHKIPVGEYASVKKFFDDMAQDESQKIVVLKEAGEKKAF